MNYINVQDQREFDPDNPLNKPDVPEDVQEAIRTLIRWSGDDPEREGLLDTPKRVGRALLEYCQDIKKIQRYILAEYLKRSVAMMK